MKFASIFVAIFVIGVGAQNGRKSVCVDNRNDCIRMARFCKENGYTEFRSQYCSKTCKMCNANDGGATPLWFNVGEVDPEVSWWMSKKIRCDNAQSISDEGWRSFGAEIANFSTTLYKELIKTQSSNLIYSPISLGVLLSMLYEGSNGTTKAKLRYNLFKTIPPEQIQTLYASALDYLENPRDSATYNLHIGNAIVSDDSLRQADNFKSLMQSCYRTYTMVIDFSEPARVASVVNDMISRSTEAKVNNLLDASAITPMGQLILANGIYFKANWLNSFTRGENLQYNFEPLDGAPFATTMMSQENVFPFAVNTALSCKVLGLPYTNKTSTMFLFLPNDKKGIHRLEAKLNGKALSDAMMAMKDQAVDVVVPKFTISSDLDLQQALSTIGLQDLFNSQADFSGMVTSYDPNNKPNAFISRVVQKSIIEVHERGTEAAAASGIVMSATSAKPTFFATHPFIFVLRDNPTNTILFMGRVMNPNAAV